MEQDARGTNAHVLIQPIATGLLPPPLSLSVER